VGADRQEGVIHLNLGAGKKLRADALNVDMTPYWGIDLKVDLAKYPWPWDDGEVDGIFVSHLLEHFQDQEKFILECHRILMPGGFLRIVGPHSSCISSVGCLGHHRTYSYSTFDDYLAKPFYMFKAPLFVTKFQRLTWWYEDPDAEKNLPRWTIPIIKVIDYIINRIIAINPKLWENISPIQCREVVWVGEKI